MNMLLLTYIFLLRNLKRVNKILWLRGRRTHMQKRLNHPALSISSKTVQMPKKIIQNTILIPDRLEEAL